MEDLASNSPVPGKGEVEDARVGYETAINYSILNQNIIWSIFNTMLVANSLVVAGIGIIHSIPILTRFFQIFLPLMGIFICFIWFLLVKRHLKLSSFYLYSARSLEECYFKNTVTTFHDGGKYSDGETISLIVDGKVKNFHMDFLEKIPGRKSLYGLISVFALFYLAAFFI
jgi:hypothetical protein